MLISNVGLTLEELDSTFSIPTKIHMRYGRQQLVYVIKYYFMWKRDTPKPQLIVHFDKPPIRRKGPLRKISFEHLDEKPQSSECQSEVQPEIKDELRNRESKRQVTDHELA